MRKRPGFTSAAVLTLALGIGATTAVFSVVHPLLLRALPFSEPDCLVMLLETRLPRFPEFAVAPGNLVGWRESSRTLSRVVGVKGFAVSLTGGGEPERLRGERVTEGFFDFFGVQPILGRGFRAEEELPGGPDVIVVSHGLWQRRFGGDPAVLGRTVVLDGKPHVIVGVMPAGLHRAMGDVDLWTPAALSVEERQYLGRTLVAGAGAAGTGRHAGRGGASSSIRLPRGSSTTIPSTSAGASRSCCSARRSSAACVRRW